MASCLDARKQLPASHKTECPKMEPTRVIVATPDFTLPETDGLPHNCCICRSEGLSTAPCSSFLLPNSGVSVASKLSSITKVLNIRKRDFSVAFCCQPCLTLLMGLDGVEGEWEKRLRELKDRHHLSEDGLIEVVKSEPVDPDEVEDGHSKASTSGENDGLPVQQMAEVVFSEKPLENSSSIIKIEQSEHLDPLATTGGTPDEFDSYYSPSPSSGSEAEESSSRRMRNGRKRGPPRKRGRPRTKVAKSTEKVENSNSMDSFEGKLMVLSDIRNYLKFKKHIIGLPQWYRLDSCRLCQKEFQDAKPLVKHHRETHPDQPFFLCHFCLRGFYTPNEFGFHVMEEELRLCLEGGFAKCKICDQDLGNPRRLEAHFKECHEGCKGGCFVCDDCEENFTSYELFIRHRQTTHDVNPAPTLPQSSVCPKCKKDFADVKGGLEHHFLTVEFNPKWNCDECGIQFKGTKYITKHVNDFHLNIRPYICKICGNAFPDQPTLTGHEQRHKRKKVTTPQMCPICGKAYTSDLKYHMDMVHYKVEKWKCRHCPEKFTAAPALKRHMAVAHQIAVDQFQHPCNVCGKVFPGLINLKYHRFLVHKIPDPKIQIRPCPVCGKEFVHKSMLKKHLKSHERREGIKTCFKCPETGCAHTEVDPISLKRHMRYVHAKLDWEWEGGDGCLGTGSTGAPGGDDDDDEEEEEGESADYEEGDGDDVCD